MAWVSSYCKFENNHQVPSKATSTACLWVWREGWVIKHLCGQRKGSRANMNCRKKKLIERKISTPGTKWANAAPELGNWGQLQAERNQRQHCFWGRWRESRRKWNQESVGMKEKQTSQCCLLQSHHHQRCSWRCHASRWGQKTALLAGNPVHETPGNKKEREKTYCL